MRAALGVVLSAVAGVAMLLRTEASAAEIKVMCPAPMATTIVDLVGQFEKSSGHKVTIVHTPSRFIIERIRAGEAADITLLTHEATDRLVSEGKLARRVDFAVSSIGVAVRKGAPHPDVGSAEALKRTLLAVKSFARNEGAESGIHMLKVFERLGIADEMKAKTIAMPVGTGYVAQLVADGKAEMAAQQMPELHAVPGVDPTPLPKDLQMTIVFAVGVSPTLGDRAAVESLVSFLTGPAAAPVLRARGLVSP